ncbi:MAG: hypothetical protein ACR2PZ_22055 [Pseudomonadales bacterium]
MFHMYQWPRRYAYAHSCTSGSHRPFYESRGQRHSSFGVRRPLRYLSYHLDLDEGQRRRLAASLDRIKLEREQLKLNRKRTDAALAETFLRVETSVDALAAALSPNAESEVVMQHVIAKELFEIANVLDADQREEFAHLLRSGVLKL